MSKVFQRKPQSQTHRSSSTGSQAHRGHRIFGLSLPVEELQQNAIVDARVALTVWISGSATPYHENAIDNIEIGQVIEPELGPGHTQSTSTRPSPTTCAARGSTDGSVGNVHGTASTCLDVAPEQRPGLHSRMGFGPAPRCAVERADVEARVTTLLCVTSDPPRPNPPPPPFQPAPRISRARARTPTAPRALPAYRPLREWFAREVRSPHRGGE